MAQRRHHYERAFEAYLRDRRIPYVSVDDARKALLPDGAGLRIGRAGLGVGGLGSRDVPGSATGDAERAGLVLGEDGIGVAGDGGDGAGTHAGERSLKSFDFVLYGDQENLLVEVKGRKIGRASGPRGSSGRVSRGDGSREVSRRRLECWVTREDLESLRTWERLFGAGFEAVFCFCYWCEEQPPDGLFQELIVHQDRWYAMRAVRLGDYLSTCRVRSPRWGTYDLPAGAFERLSHPLASTRLDSWDAGPIEPMMRALEGV